MEKDIIIALIEYKHKQTERTLKFQGSSLQNEKITLAIFLSINIVNKVKKCYNAKEIK